MRRMKWLILSLAVALAGCSSQRRADSGAAPPEELRVSAAISLKEAFDEIGRLHEGRTGIKVVFNYGASGVLQKQIENAAPIDVFASAGAKQMDALGSRGLIVPETRRDFARNALVLIIPRDAAFKPSSFEQLAQTQLKKLAVGNPKTVPAGQYAEQLLNNLKLWPQLQTRLVFAEDVRQVLDYVARGEVEAGIVYASDVAAAKDAVSVAARASESSHDPILYPVAVVKDSRRQAAARGFVELILGAEGQAILGKHGFLGVSR